MQAIFILTFILIVGIISSIPLHSNNPSTSAVPNPTNTPVAPTATSAPTTPQPKADGPLDQTSQPTPTVTTLPTIQVKPITRHGDDSGNSDN